MTISTLAESFKTMNWPDPARPQRSLTAYLSESVYDRFLSKFGNDIIYSFETMTFPQRKNLVIFSSFLS